MRKRHLKGLFATWLINDERPRRAIYLQVFNQSIANTKMGMMIMNTRRVESNAFLLGIDDFYCQE